MAEMQDNERRLT
jgi:dynein heavy chain